MEDTVEILTETTQDDAARNQGESLETVIAEEQADEPVRKEPGYVKKRISAEVAKAVAETEARMAAKYEEMLAPIRESVLEREAQQLVSSGQVKDLEMAKEYLRLKQGVTRGGQERPAPKTESEPVSQVASILARQAQKIKAKQGLDVMQIFNSDPDVKQKILSGEWDFYDVVEQMQETPSAPVRSPNSGSVTPASIMDMTDAQFQRLQANLAAGRSYNVRRR